MDNNCYICLEHTDTFINFNNCSCKIYIHDECISDMLKVCDNCIICKSSINKDNINELISNNWIIWFINIISTLFYDDVIFLNHLEFNYSSILLFIIYLFFIFIPIIVLSIIKLCLYVFYIYHFKNKKHKNMYKIYKLN
jgi:hypothetical protein